MILLPLVLGQSTAVFDKCIAAHLAMSKASVVVSIRATTGSNPVSSRAEVAYIRPDRARLRVSTGRSGQTAPSERTYTLIGMTMYGVDLKTKEWLIRPVPTTKKAISFIDRWNSVVGKLDEPLTYLLDPSAFKVFLTRMKAIPGWKYSQNTSETTASLAIPNMGNYNFRFSAANSRLLAGSIRTGKKLVEWSYRYETPPASITFSKPAGAVKVTTFQDRKTPAKFADGKARDLYQASFLAYRRLQSVRYTVSDPAGIWAVDFARREISQKTTGSQFTYAKGVLKATRNGKVSKISCTPADLPFSLAKVKQPLEPVLRFLIERGNPIERLISNDLTVRFRGSIQVGSVKFDILEAARSDYRLTLHIRSDNRFLGATISEQLDRRGNMLKRTERRFTYR